MNSSIFKIKILKYLAYFNLIYSGLILWTGISINSFYPDYLEYLLLGLSIWYSWETIKQLKGLKNNFNKINHIIGILILVLGGLYILGLLLIFLDGYFHEKKALIIIGVLKLPLGISIFSFTIMTLRYYRNKNITIE